MQGIQAWTEDWFKLLALLNLDGSNDVNISAIEAQLSIRLTDQVRALNQLFTLGSEIERQSLAGKRILAGAGTFDPNLFSEGKDVVLRLMKSKNDLDRSFSELGAIPNKSIPKLREVMEISKNGAMAKLKIRLIEKGLNSLLPSVIAVENLLAAQEKIEPPLAELAELERAANESLLFTRPFHLKASNVQSQALCSTLQKIILAEKAKVSESFIQNNLDRVNLFCKNIEDYQAQLAAISRSPAKLVQGYLKTISPSAKRKCSTSPTPTYCEKFAILAGIPAKTFEDFPASRLEFIETRFRSFYKSIVT